MNNWDLRELQHRDVQKRALSLAEAGDEGNFFVRTVRSRPGCCGLTVKVGDGLSNFLIQPAKKRGKRVYVLRGCKHAFPSIANLVRYFSLDRRSPLPCPLVIVDASDADLSLADKLSAEVSLGPSATRREDWDSEGNDDDSQINGDHGADSDSGSSEGSIDTWAAQAQAEMDALFGDLGASSRGGSRASDRSSPGPRGGGSSNGTAPEDQGAETASDASEELGEQRAYAGGPVPRASLPYAVQLPNVAQMMAANPDLAYQAAQVQVDLLRKEAEVAKARMQMYEVHAKMVRQQSDSRVDAGAGDSGGGKARRRSKDREAHDRTSKKKKKGRKASKAKAKERGRRSSKEDGSAPHGDVPDGEGEGGISRKRPSFHGQVKGDDGVGTHSPPPPDSKPRKSALKSAGGRGKKKRLSLADQEERERVARETQAQMEEQLQDLNKSNPGLAMAMQNHMRTLERTTAKQSADAQDGPGTPARQGSKPRFADAPVVIPDTPPRGVGFAAAPDGEDGAGAAALAEEREFMERQMREEKAQLEVEKARVRREAEELERVRRELEASRSAEAQRLAEERARFEAEAEASRKAAEDSARQAAAAKAQQEEKERRAREAAEAAAREAEHKARQEAEARAKQEAVEKQQREEEERRKEEDRKRREEEAQRREEEERKAREAAAKAQREEEERQAKEEEERRKQAEEAARLQREAEERVAREAAEAAKQARLEADRKQREKDAKARAIAARHRRKEESERWAARMKEASNSKESFGIVKRRIPEPVAAPEATATNETCTFLGNCQCPNCR